MTEQRYRVRWRYYESPGRVWTYIQSAQLEIYDAVHSIMMERVYSASHGVNADYWLELV